MSKCWPTEGVICYDKAAVFQVCKLVKAAIGNTPLIAKICYFPKFPNDLLAEIVDAVAPFAAAISAINTFAAPVLNDHGQQAMPGYGRLKAGISGHAIKDLGLDMTRRLHELRERKEPRIRNHRYWRCPDT